MVLYVLKNAKSSQTHKSRFTLFWRVVTWIHECVREQICKWTVARPYVTGGLCPTREARGAKPQPPQQGAQNRVRTWSITASFPIFGHAPLPLPPHLLPIQYQAEKNKSQICSPNQSCRIPLFWLPASSFLVPINSSQGTPETFHYEAFSLLCLPVLTPWPQKSSE